MYCRFNDSVVGPCSPGPQTQYDRADGNHMASITLIVHNERMRKENLKITATGERKSPAFSAHSPWSTVWGSQLIVMNRRWTVDSGSSTAGELSTGNATYSKRPNALCDNENKKKYVISPLYYWYNICWTGWLIFTTFATHFRSNRSFANVSVASLSILQPMAAVEIEWNITTELTGAVAAQRKPWPISVRESLDRLPFNRAWLSIDCQIAHAENNFSPW